MRRSMVCAFAAMMVVAGFANVAFALPSWQTTPVLGIDSMYTGDVLINNTGDPLANSLLWANVPHDVLDSNSQPVSMTTFMVGQSIHSGSGVFLDAGETYYFTSIFSDVTNASRSRSYSGTFVSDGFWMTWNSPDAYGSGADGGGVPTLTTADVGDWRYSETYAFADDHEHLLLDIGVGFITVEEPSPTIIPEPATMSLFATGLTGLVAAVLRRRKQARE